MKIKLLIFFLAMSFSAYAQYVNTGTGQWQRQVSGADTTYRFVPSSVTAAPLYLKSFNWSRNNFVNTTGNQSNIAGIKTWIDTHYWSTGMPYQTEIGAGGINITKNGYTVAGMTNLGTMRLQSGAALFYGEMSANVTAIRAWVLPDSSGNIALNQSVDTKLALKAPLTGVGTSGTWPISISGNSATSTSATTLANTRTIWGQNFNGSANVTGALTGVTTITASSDIMTSGRLTVGATQLIGWSTRSLMTSTGNGVIDFTANNGTALTRLNFGPSANNSPSLVRNGSGLSLVATDNSDNSLFAASILRATGLAANRAITTNVTRDLVSSATTDTELGYLSGVTSAIQTQLNAKGSGTVTSITPGYGFTSATPITTTGTLTIDTASATGIVSKARLTSYLALGAKLGANNTFTAVNNFTSNVNFSLTPSVNSGGGIRFWNTGNTFSGVMSAPTLATNRTYTLPDATGTVALTTDIPSNYVTTNSTQTGLSGGKTWTGTHIYSIGGSQGVAIAPGSIQSYDTGLSTILYPNYLQFLQTSGSYVGNITYTTLTGSRTWNLPDASGNVQLVPIVNTGITSIQTSATLNSTYPSAFVGQQVTAPNVGTGMKYEKINTTGGGVWIAWAVSTI